MWYSATLDNMSPPAFLSQTDPALRMIIHSLLLLTYDLLVEVWGCCCWCWFSVATTLLTSQTLPQQGGLETLEWREPAAASTAPTLLIVLMTPVHRQLSSVVSEEDWSLIVWHCCSGELGPGHRADNTGAETHSGDTGVTSAAHWSQHLESIGAELSCWPRRCSLHWTLFQKYFTGLLDTLDTAGHYWTPMTWPWPQHNSAMKTSIPQTHSNTSLNKIFPAWRWFICCIKDDNWILLKVAFTSVPSHPQSI